MSKRTATTATKVKSDNKPRKLTGTLAGIPPRQINMTYSEKIPRYSVAGNAFATIFMAAFSGGLTGGEQFVIDSLRRYRDRITDVGLRAKVSGLIGQESIHSREHERLNDYFVAQGIDVRIPYRAVRMALKLMERLPERTQLACSAFIEHFTARMAQTLLTQEEKFADQDPEILKLWLWHAVEELEHKSVAYDVFVSAGGKRVDRVVAIAVFMLLIGPPFLSSIAWLVWRENKFLKPIDTLLGANLYFGPKGLFTSALPKVPVFLKRDFHPAKHNTDALLAEWRDKMFGKDGQLLDVWSNPDATALPA